jgi:hypothetical protein
VLLTFVGERLCAVEYDALELGLRRSSRRAFALKASASTSGGGLQTCSSVSGLCPSVACATDSTWLPLDQRT